MKTTDSRSFFTNKTITLMGLGLLGRGIGDAAFLAQYCKKLYVTDMKSVEDLRSAVEALKDYGNIEFMLGGHDSRIFAGIDFVVKGAGVRLDNPYIQHAEKHGVPVYMSTALFAKLAPLKTIGVTGTRGKTTTTCMIVDILKRAGKKVLLGGNIRGVSTLAQLPEAMDYDLAVLELDSWQLQGFDSLQISPNVAVFTTFYPDHMNYYDNDMARYWRDKSAIFRHQKNGDTFVMSSQVAAQLRQYEKEVPENAEIVDALPSDFQLKIPGQHNLLNAATAKAAAHACGVRDEIIDAALHDFAGVEGRLQWIGRWRDRDFYNDSNATTQEATLAALNAFPPESIVLIFGGADKGLALDGLVSFIAEHKIRCALIKGTGSNRVLQHLPDLQVVGSMPEAVNVAVDQSKPGDRIILSPAFASFGVFKNEYDRSDQFLGEVKNRLAEA
jgi:UDP-N-acetylmuramoylalanine--D-glutamate ligase